MLKNYKKDFILFAEAGFIAINQADEDSALKLFKAASLLDPTNSLVEIGYGYLHLHKLELPQSIRCFEDAIKKDPKSDMAKALLGLAKSMTLNQVIDGEKILRQTEKSSDQEVKKLSKLAIDFVDKFVKKEPSPVEIKKPKS